MTHCNEHWQTKTCGQKGVLCDTLSHYSFRDEIFFFCGRTFPFSFQEWKVGTQGQGDGWDWDMM